MGKRKRTSLKVLRLFLFLLGLSIIALGISALWFFDASILKNYKSLNRCFFSSVHRVELCESSPEYVELENISLYFVEAVLVSEDDKFFNHEGFDWKEIKNSLGKNIQKLSFSRGGSTITQQFVKNAYLTQRKSLYRKLLEWKISYHLERKYSKKLILERYLNLIELGKNLYGVKMAARYYFSKPPSELGVLESLYLAILLPSPIKYSKSFSQGKLTNYQKNRIKTLLKRLRKKRVIDKDYEASLIKEIDLFPWDENFYFEEF